MAAALNEDGLVKVGGYIFQYTATQMKVMPANNKAKINVLKNAKTDNHDEGIVVKNIEKGTSKTYKGGRSEATDFSAWIEEGVVVFQNAPEINTVILRYVRGSVDLYTSYEPIYNCTTLACWKDEENPPYIIGWRVNQSFLVYAQQWQRTIISVPIPLCNCEVSWENEAPTDYLSVSSGASPYTGFQTGSGISTIYFIRSSNVAHNVSGTVTISGFGGSSASATIN